MPMTPKQKDAAARFLDDILGRFTGRVAWCHCASCRAPMPVRELESHVCGAGVTLLDLLREKRHSTDKQGPTCRLCGRPREGHDYRHVFQPRGD